VSFVWPAVFVTYINGLPLRINSVSETIIFADGISVKFSSKNVMILVQCKTKLCLIIKWVAAELLLNVDTKNITNNSPHCA
jgi:hypothetical protein